MTQVNRFNIYIYSKNKFIKELLKQQGHMKNLLHYTNCSKSPKLDLKDIQNLILLDCTENLDGIDNLINKFYSISQIVVLSNKPMETPNLKNNKVEFIEAPLYYTNLCDLINNRYEFISYISKNLLLNEKFKLLVKIKNNIVKNIFLTDTELSLIKYLLQSKNNKNKEDILSKVFGYNSLVHTHTLEAHIYRLRQKIGNDIKFIEHTDNGYKIFS